MQTCADCPMRGRIYFTDHYVCGLTECAVQLEDPCGATDDQVGNALVKLALIEEERLKVRIAEAEARYRGERENDGTATR